MLAVAKMGEGEGEGEGRSLVSCDDADSPPLAGEAKELRKKRKTIVYEDGEEVNQVSSPPNSDEEEEEEVGEDAKPIGDVVRVSGKGESRRNHFKGFEADGLTYELEDTVLIIPEEHSMKPSVAIIKDITAMGDGIITVIGQRFYRPEVAEKENGGNWDLGKARELFYSFDKSKFPADSIMHKCLVHFVPPNKKIPSSQEHPGFIVRKVYHAKSKRLSELLDKDYEDCRQREIDVLVQKTIARIPNWQEQL